jgi:hypothetical protein
MLTCRFEKDDMPCLHKALKIPQTYTGYQGSFFTGMEEFATLIIIS